MCGQPQGEPHAAASDGHGPDLAAAAHIVPEILPVLSAHKRSRSTIDQVVGLSKLKTKYEAHEAKRRLCGEYDFFVADDRILPSLPKLLGGCPQYPNAARRKTPCPRLQQQAQAAGQQPAEAPPSISVSTEEDSACGV